MVIQTKKCKKVYESEWYVQEICLITFSNNNKNKNDSTARL